MDDAPVHERAYTGKLRYRFRLRPFIAALEDAWKALWGWERTVICRRDDEGDPTATEK